VVGSDKASGAAARAVHSSGGAAGGVVSEGQGYGLVLAGGLAAALPPDHPRRADVLEKGYELFLGWKRMAERTTIGSCQGIEGGAAVAHLLCGEGGEHECFPSWKFDDAVEEELGFGSATDGDEDAVLGMILLVVATAQDATPPVWRDQVATWAFQSCLAFAELLTVPCTAEAGCSAAAAASVSSSGVPLRITRLGSCWGGWNSCNNPSYLAPGHYRVFSGFVSALASTLGDGSEGAALAPSRACSHRYTQ